MEQINYGKDDLKKFNEILPILKEVNEMKVYQGSNNERYPLIFDTDKGIWMIANQKEEDI